MSDKRQAYLAEVRERMVPGDANTVPSVVYDLPMPPYRFQKPDFGGGSIGQRIAPDGGSAFINGGGSAG
jgi:hypothetical protein